MTLSPNLLLKPARQGRLEVFLCGPGQTALNYRVREALRKHVVGNLRANVTYGEHLPTMPSQALQRTDLQTLEARFAHSVDCTILMLDTPGSIAELGTFSMISNIRSRLIVLLSDRFFGAESYIARGPLSLITKDFPSRVIYYNDKSIDDLKNRVLDALTFYLYAIYTERYNYLYEAREAFKRRDYKPSQYTNYIKPIRDRYCQAAVLIASIIKQNPTFAELVRLSKLSPDEVSNALSVLIPSGSISKIADGRYSSPNSYSDPLLAPFSSVAISRSRAKLVAA